MVSKIVHTREKLTELTQDNRIDNHQTKLGQKTHQDSNSNIRNCHLTTKKGNLQRQ